MERSILITKDIMINITGYMSTGHSIVFKDGVLCVLSFLIWIQLSEYYNVKDFKRFLNYKDAY
jgi:hypothetical protein